jgi:hypothetical protein
VTSIDARRRALGLSRNLLALLALVQVGVINRADLSGGRPYSTLEAQRLVAVLAAVESGRREAARLAGLGAA